MPVLYCAVSTVVLLQPCPDHLGFLLNQARTSIWTCSALALSSPRRSPPPPPASPARSGRPAALPPCWHQQTPRPGERGVAAERQCPHWPTHCSCREGVASHSRVIAAFTSHGSIHQSWQHSRVMAVASNLYVARKVSAAAVALWGTRSRRRGCHFAYCPSPSLLKRLPKAEGGASE